MKYNKYIFYGLTMRSLNIPESPYLLNFEKDVSFPEFLNDTLSLMVGAGDLCHGGVPNVNFFSHNVFFCNAWDNNGSLQENVNYLNEHKNKVVCVVDYDKKEQMKKFIELFKGRFILIDGHGGHTPHFTVHEYNQLLAEQGEAMNIFERSESLITEKEMRTYLTKGTLPGINPTKRILTSRIHNMTDEHSLRVLMIQKIGQYSDKIILEDISLSSLQTSDLQYLLTAFLYQWDIPLNMKGFIRMNQRNWKNAPCLELVLKKIPVDFMESLIEICSRKERANMIVAKIKEDIESGFVFGSHAKYNTLTQMLKI
jgi:hypothetical protein